MSNLAYTLTIDGDTYESYVDATTAEKERANNLDISVQDDFSFTDDEGARYLLLATRFVEAQTPVYPLDIGDAAITSDDVVALRRRVAVAVVREAMARSPNSDGERPSSLRAITDTVAETTEVSFAVRYNSSIVSAANRGFFDQVAHDILLPYLPVDDVDERSAAEGFSVAVPRSAQRETTFFNYELPA